MTLNVQDPQLDLAARFLGSMMAMDRNRTLADRDDDIDHALDVAEELIRRRRARSPSTPAMTLELRPPIETREEVVKRDQISVEEWRAERRSAQKPPSPRKPPGHTLH